MKKRFTITYDIVTEESAEHGDFAYNGYVTDTGDTPRESNYIPVNPETWTLREAYDYLTEKDDIDCVETDSCPWSPSNPPRWITFSGRLVYDECTSFALHPAKRNSISASSMCRIARLFNAYGERKD
jgi:hypothetical protein